MNPQVFHGVIREPALKSALTKRLCGLTLYLWGITLGQRGNLLFWEQEVASSNLAAPTIFPFFVCRVFFHGVLILPILPIKPALKSALQFWSAFRFSSRTLSHLAFAALRFNSARFGSPFPAAPPLAPRLAMYCETALGTVDLSLSLLIINSID